jgi:hypothetical protein
MNKVWLNGSPPPPPPRRPQPATLAPTPTPTPTPTPDRVDTCLSGVDGRGRRYSPRPSIISPLRRLHPYLDYPWLELIASEPRPVKTPAPVCSTSAPPSRRPSVTCSFIHGPLCSQPFSANTREFILTGRHTFTPATPRAPRSIPLFISPAIIPTLFPPTSFAAIDLRFAAVKRASTSCAPSF